MKSKSEKKGERNFDGSTTQHYKDSNGNVTGIRVTEADGKVFDTKMGKDCKPTPVFGKKY